MSKNAKPVRIAVNVMRSRLTVIGFNIAIVSFMIVDLSRALGGLNVPGIDHPVHVVADMALFMALALSLIALLAFIMSSAFDEVGFCTHWSFVAGDLLMYSALAQTVTGFFAPLTTSIELFSAKLPEQASTIAILHSAPLIAGGLAWFIATYAGPIVSLVRSPFSRRTNIILGCAYLTMLVILAWVSSHATQLEAAVPDDRPGLIICILRELIQPFIW